MPRSSSNTRLVFSTDGGGLCRQCQRKLTACVCGNDKPSDTGDGIVRIHRQSKGRGGKTVTLITGLSLSPDATKTLAKALKQRCGVGGAVKNGDIEIQGDQRELIKTELEKKGHIVKLAGG